MRVFVSADMIKELRDSLPSKGADILYRSANVDLFLMNSILG